MFTSWPLCHSKPARETSLLHMFMELIREPEITMQDLTVHCGDDCRIGEEDGDHKNTYPYWRPVGHKGLY